MKKLLLMVVLLFIPSILSAQENSENIYSKEKLQEFAPQGVVITGLKSSGNNIDISFTATSNNKVSEFMRNISEGLKNSPNLVSLKREKDNAGMWISVGVIRINK